VTQGVVQRTHPARVATESIRVVEPFGRLSPAEQGQRGYLMPFNSAR
jgi:hypothetical protein